jgi:hypothetical protein
MTHDEARGESNCPRGRVLLPKLVTALRRDSRKLFLADLIYGPCSKHRCLGAIYRRQVPKGLEVYEIALRDLVWRRSELLDQIGESCLFAGVEQPLAAARQQLGLASELDIPQMRN